MMIDDGSPFGLALLLCTMIEWRFWKVFFPNCPFCVCLCANLISFSVGAICVTQANGLVSELNPPFLQDSAWFVAIQLAVPITVLVEWLFLRFFSRKTPRARQNETLPQRIFRSSFVQVCIANVISFVAFLAINLPVIWFFDNYRNFYWRNQPTLDAIESTLRPFGNIVGLSLVLAGFVFFVSRVQNTDAED